MKKFKVEMKMVVVVEVEAHDMEDAHDMAEIHWNTTGRDDIQSHEITDCKEIK